MQCNIKRLQKLRLWNDDVRWKTKQPHLSATVQARRLSLVGHTA